jgi:methylated-DNA-[protein]-cysteine S-methyltransferase
MVSGGLAGDAVRETRLIGLRLRHDMKRVMSEFARKVYDAVVQIPAGRVSTYKKVAERIRCKSPRAVGQALRVNPFAPTVPCHRVIASDLRLGGFQGYRGGVALKRKQDMLAAEGVRFVGGRLEESGRVWGWDSPRGARDC